MHFFKKFCLLFSLTAITLVLAASENQNPVVKRHHDNLTHIVQVFNKALAPHLIRIAAIVPADTDSLPFSQIHQAIKQEMPALKRTFADAFKNQLNHEQQELVSDLLHGLKEKSKTTTRDLMQMAESCCTYELRNAQNEAFKLYCPADLREASEKGYTEETRILNRKARKEICKKIAQIDMHNAIHNMLNRFMCTYTYTEDACLIAALPVENNLLHTTCVYMVKTTALPFVVFNDFYFIPGWQDEFKKTGMLFEIMHNVCSQLLEVV